MDSNLERRVYIRFRCGGRAALHKFADDLVYPAKILEVSAGGCLLDVDDVTVAESLEVGVIVEVAFKVSGESFRVSAEVRSRRSGTVIGFRFDQLSSRTTARLRELVQGLERNCKDAQQARAAQE